MDKSITVIRSLIEHVSMFYFDIEPRLKLNKIILTDKLILFDFRRQVWSEIKCFSG